MTNQPNYGWKFYRDYYHDVNFWETDKKRQEGFFKSKNKTFENARLEMLFSDEVEFQGFPLRLVYPGLLSGVGYSMGVGMIGEFKIGFYFDYTTGMPVLPGSSVKGVLRSIFPSSSLKELNGKLKRSSKNNKQKAFFIWNLICDLDGIDKKKFVKKEDGCFLNENEEKIIRQIELEIFEGRNIGKELEYLRTHKELTKEEFSGIYKSDIFFDAYIQKPVDKGYTKDKIFGTDSITPHHENPLKNPTPLLFLKVLPGTTWNFCFDFKSGFHLTAEQKNDLFKQIILTIGLGAKTNVGYGQFEDLNNKNEVGKSEIIHEYTELSSSDLENSNIKTNTKNENLKIKDIVPPSAELILVKGVKVSGVVDKQYSGYNFFKFSYQKKEFIIRKRVEKNPDLQVGEIVNIEFSFNYSPENSHMQVKKA